MDARSNGAYLTCKDAFNRVVLLLNKIYGGHEQETEFDKDGEPLPRRRGENEAIQSIGTKEVAEESRDLSNLIEPILTELQRLDEWDLHTPMRVLTEEGNTMGLLGLFVTLQLFLNRLRTFSETGANRRVLSQAGDCVSLVHELRRELLAFRRMQRIFGRRNTSQACLRCGKELYQQY